MNPITAAVLKAGLISPAMLREMKRISPSLDQDAEAETPVDLDMAAKLVEDALQSEKYVIVRETDLEVLRQYTTTAQQTILHVEPEPGEGVDIEVSYGKTPIGEYIIAWRSDDLQVLMTNGLTYLVEGTTHVYFHDVRELFFGEQKSFVVCSPSVVEPNAH